jgi:hypothetical protein
MRLRGAAPHANANSAARCVEVGAAQTRVSFGIYKGRCSREIDRIEPGSIDTVFCFGYFYHTLHQLLLLSKITLLKPRYLIIDTQIDLCPVDRILVRSESTEDEGNVALASAKRTVVGLPSWGALQLMLASFAWTPCYYDWHRAGIHLWDDLPDYHEGLRVSLVIDCGV